MKIKTTLLFFIFLQININAQMEFSPPGAEWCYSVHGGFSEDQGFFHLAYSSDTLIKGKPCKILKGISVYGFPNNCCDTIFNDITVYQSSDSIYVYMPAFDDFSFMFRNDMELGEMVEFPFLFMGILQVESVDSIVINSSLLRSFKLPYAGTGNTYIFDKAGPNRGYFDDWGAVAWDGMEYSLHWYKDDAIPEFYLLNQPCGMFTSVFEPLTENPISVFPNPVSEVLEIGFQNGRITYWVYDLSGRQVLHKKEMLENKLEVGHLMPGLYFLAVENNGVFYWAKFVKN